MPRPKKSTPTDGELKILRIMWERGPVSIRDIRDGFDKNDCPSHSALRETIDTLLKKRFARLADARRPQKFEAIVSQQSTYDSMTSDLRKRVFGGSLRALISSALGGKKSTAADLDELKSLVKELGR